MNFTGFMLSDERLIKSKTIHTGDDQKGSDSDE